MDTAYRSFTRILTTSDAANIIAEVTQDLLVRWPNLNGGINNNDNSHELIAAGRQLAKIGQYIATFRIRASRVRTEREKEYIKAQSNFIDRTAHWIAGGWMPENPEKVLLRKNDVDMFKSMLLVISNTDKAGVDSGVLLLASATKNQHAATTSWLAALSLLAGLLQALGEEEVVDPLVDQTQAQFVSMLRTASYVIAHSFSASVCHSAVEVVLAIAKHIIPDLSKVNLRNLVAPDNRDNSGNSILSLWTTTIFDPIDGLLPTSNISLHALGLCERLAQHPLIQDMGFLVRTAAVLIDNAPFEQVAQVSGLLYANAVSILVLFERDSNSLTSPLPNVVHSLLVTDLFATMQLLESIAQRFFVDDGYLRIPEPELLHLWAQTLDTMASIHFITLGFGREGTEGFKRASSLAIQFILRRPGNQINAAFSSLVRKQPCLSYIVSAGVESIHRARSFLVLFYMDLTEQLIPHLSNHTLSTFVLPLASCYAQRTALVSVGPDWFETAHAVILGILELVATDDSNLSDSGGASKRERAELVLEVVPWYTELLLAHYPDGGISGDLLRIAYTASVRAATTNNALSNMRIPNPRTKILENKDDFDGPHEVDFNLGYALAWDRTNNLIKRIDILLSNAKEETNVSNVRRAVDSVHRRELLLVLADQTTSLPLVLLPKLMDEICIRVREEPDGAVKVAVVDALQDIALSKADLARKAAISKWVWGLRSEINSKI